MVKTSDLTQRDVINIKDGKRLGIIYDIEINLEKGQVTSIIIPGPGKFLGIFGKDNDLIIPWRHIKKIGEDVILVDASNYTDLTDYDDLNEED